MKKTNRKAYKGYKQAHLITAIATIILGLCLIAAVIIVVTCFKVEVKVEAPTTTVTQIQPINSDGQSESEAKHDAEPDAATDTTTDAESNITTTTDAESNVEIINNIPTENPVEENTEIVDTIKYSTLTVTVNIYTNICRTKFVEFTMPVGTTLTLAQIKELILDEFPTFNYARTIGVPSSYTFTEENNSLPGIVKISTITVEATETEENNPEVIQTETEEPTVVETPEPEAEATETGKDNQEVTPTETEEPAQAPTEVEPEAEPVEEPIIDINNTSILTVTVNIYTNICKTVFVNIEKPVGTTMTKQEIKDYILSLYPGFNRVRSTGTSDSYTFVEEDGQLPGVIKID